MAHKKGVLLALGFLMVAGLVRAASLSGGGVAASEPGILEGEADPGSARDIGAAGTQTDFWPIEEAGSVPDAEENRVDGSVSRIQDGHMFAHVDSLVELSLNKGASAEPGTEYLVYREAAQLGAQAPARKLGTLDITRGVVRVERVFEGKIVARVVKQYDNVLEGDLLRSRSAEMKRYAQWSLRSLAAGPAALKGEVVGLIPPALLAVSGDIVYLSLGIADGVSPGLRLRIENAGPDRPAVLDDVLGNMPLSPVSPVLPIADDETSVLPSGAIAVVEVVNATHWACAARVLKESSVVRVGDRVLYP